MKKRILSLFAAISILFDPALSRGDQGLIRDIVQSADTLGQFEMIEISATVAAGFSNPYDYDEIDLTAVIMTPDNRTVRAPSYYSGDGSTWIVRYTPTKPGEYSYRLALKTPAGTSDAESRKFTVTPGEGDGFLRKGNDNPFYPVFDSGKPFFGIGHNVAWATNNNISTFAKYFIAMSRSGCNITRIWTNNPWSFQIEPKKIGSYDSIDCGKLDSVIKLAEKYRVYIILVLDTYGALMDEKGMWAEHHWKTSPYNAANGGPCEKPWDFFTNATAKRFYKNRLKYIAARWGYSPNVMAFELLNEVNSPPAWTAEMAAYLKSVNPSGQFVTTSLGYPWGDNFDESSIWSLPEVDIIVRHVYGNQTRDAVENIVSLNREFTKRYGKMILIDEFGMDSNKSDADLDAMGTGAALHASLWAAALTKSFAGAMNWWWADYVRDKDLYPHYRALAAYVRGVDWSSPTVETVATGPVLLASGSARSYGDIAITPVDVWGSTEFSDFRVDDSGNVGGGLVNAYLHGAAKKEMRLEPVFRVNYPAEGKFAVQVDMVSQGGNLIFFLDGEQVFDRDLPAGPGEGPWKKSLYRKDHNIYQCIYNAEYEIVVPKGEHVIKLSNNGKDWIRLKKITLKGYASDAYAPARVVGLRVGGDILVWIQNKAYDWKAVRKGVGIKPVTGASLAVTGVENGPYTVEWWDTSAGTVTGTVDATAHEGRLDLNLPDFVSDTACKIRARR